MLLSGGDRKIGMFFGAQSLMLGYGGNVYLLLAEARTKSIPCHMESIEITPDGTVKILKVHFMVFCVATTGVC